MENPSVPGLWFNFRGHLLPLVTDGHFAKDKEEAPWKSLNSIIARYLDYNL